MVIKHFKKISKKTNVPLQDSSHAQYGPQGLLMSEGKAKWRDAANSIAGREFLQHSLAK